MTIGYAVEMLKNNFGRSWLDSGSFDLKVVGPVIPGDTVISGGEVKSVEDGESGSLLTCDIWVARHDGAKAVIGTAQLLYRP
jgi:hypothetical protein